MIYLNMPVGELYGWAICGKYLLRSMTKGRVVGYIEGVFDNQLREDEDTEMVNAFSVHDCVNFGTIIHTLTPEFKPSCFSWGNKNIGYMFYEKDTVSAEQLRNVKKLDVVVAGSEWNASVLRKHGVECVAIQQGVDQSVFKYKKRVPTDKFVIFSGGKWEQRKCQKTVIEAFKILKERHKDVLMIASWDNLFNQDAYREIKESLHDTKDILYIGLQSHKNMAGFMYETDVGVFPNTCEGGTNLVLMEYLSCGRPGIVNVSTGQKDVANDEHSYTFTGNILDSTVDYLDHCYNNRSECVRKGKLAHKAMSQFSWDVMAERFLSL